MQQIMGFGTYNCPVCKKRKSPEADHSACKTELAKIAIKNERKKKRQYTAQKYMDHLRICGAID
jgi:hypothetical protein